MKNTIKAMFIITIIMLGIITAGTLLNQSPSDDVSHTLKYSDETMFLTDCYYYQNGSVVKDFSIPSAIKFSDCDKNSVYFKIPNRLKNDSLVSFKTNNCFISCYVDGVCVYNQKDYSDLDGIGTVWNYVKLPTGSGGKDLQIVYEKSSYSRDLIQINQTIIGTKSEILLHSYNVNVLSAVIIILGIVVGFIFIIFGALSRNKNEKYPTAVTLDLGIFFVAFEMWQLSGNDFFGSIIDSNLLYYISYLSMMICAAPLLQFLNAIPKIRWKIYDILTILILVNAIVCTALHVQNFVKLSDSIVASHILILVSAIVSVPFIYVELIKPKNKRLYPAIAGLFVLAISATICILQFYFPEMILQFNYLTSMLAATTLVIICFIIQAIVLISYFEDARKEADFYEQMANVDQKTKLLTRVAFDKFVEEIDSTRPVKSYHIIVFDMNNLKFINDNYGHSAGDYALYSAAVMIKDVFYNVGDCYRYGGDEYVVVVKNKPDDVISNCSSELDELFATYNRHYDIKISIAKGSATSFEISGTNNREKFINVFKLADERMYSNKKMFKNQSEIEN